MIMVHYHGASQQAAVAARSLQPQSLVLREAKVEVEVLYGAIVILRRPYMMQAIYTFTNLSAEQHAISEGPCVSNTPPILYSQAPRCKASS